MSIEYDSAEFWNVLADYVQAVAKDGDDTVWGYAGPIHCLPNKWGPDIKNVWYVSLHVLNITGIPENWRKSKIERPRSHIWRAPNENTPIDTPCYIRDHTHGMWLKRFFAGGQKCWIDGSTSWSAENRRVAWSQIVLADPNDPDREPPKDWKPKPEGKT